MRTAFISLLACILFACVSPTGGLPFHMIASVQGDVVMASDANTSIVIVKQGSGDGAVRVKLEGAQFYPPIYAPVRFDGSGVFVTIRDMGGEEFSHKYELGEVLPVGLREYILGVLAPIELEAYGLEFGDVEVPANEPLEL